ncbi:MAG: glycosyltransferase family 4 protein [Sedimentisphaerales bacterium]|nr:glycosyltransferase family 4 protein [Sedimentisphaerales bacterium]
MKLMVITNNPERAGYRQRIGIYLEPLARQGIVCTVESLPACLLARRGLFRRAGEYDGVFLQKKKLNWFDARWLRAFARKIIYSYDDAILFSDKRPGRYSRAHFVPFRRTVRLADMVLVGSCYLAEQGRPFNSNVRILPLGLDVSKYGPVVKKPADGKVRLVWIGSATTLNYLQSLSACLEQIGQKYSNVVLRIIGDRFLDLEHMPVEKVQWDSHGRYAALAECDIGLAPLPDDPFTRGKCSFKVLEYAASGLPVVASPIGTNQDHVVPEKTGFLVSGPQEWTERLSELIENADLRSRMGQQGKEHAQQYDVSVIADRLAGLIQECISEQKVRR